MLVSPSPQVPQTLIGLGQGPGIGNLRSSREDGSDMQARLRSSLFILNKLLRFHWDLGEEKRFREILPTNVRTEQIYEFNPAIFLEWILWKVNVTCTLSGHDVFTAPTLLVRTVLHTRTFLIPSKQAGRASSGRTQSFRISMAPGLFQYEIG